MSQGITLYGSESVERAGYAMISASENMLRAAETMADCTRRLEFLFGQGYGSNLDLLIETLEKHSCHHSPSTLKSSAALAALDSATNPPPAPLAIAANPK